MVPIEEENPNEYWAEFHDDPKKADYALLIIRLATEHNALDKQLIDKLDSALGITKNEASFGSVGYRIKEAILQYARGKPEQLDGILKELKVNTNRIT